MEMFKACLGGIFLGFWSFCIHVVFFESLLAPPKPPKAPKAPKASKVSAPIENQSVQIHCICRNCRSHVIIIIVKYTYIYIIYHNSKNKKVYKIYSSHPFSQIMYYTQT